jgi:rod shape-determining protein MreD
VTARVGLVALLLATAVLLQTALLPLVAFGGFRPDLPLLVVIGFALRDGAATGVRVGFAAGLLTDLLLQGSAVGVSALVFVVVGYLVGIARPYLSPESVTAPLALSFAASLVGTAAYGTIARLLGDARFTLQLVVAASLFVAFANTLLSPVVIGTVRALSGRFPVEGAPLVR